MSPLVLVFALVPTPLYAWAVGRSVRRYRASVAMSMEASAGLTGKVTEAVSGREEALVSGATEGAAARVDRASERVRDRSVRQNALAALTGEGMLLLSVASASFVYVLCAVLTGLSRWDRSSLRYSWSRASTALTVQSALATLLRVAEAFPERSCHGGAKPAGAPCEIEVKDLSFRYGTEGRPLPGGLTVS